MIRSNCINSITGLLLIFGRSTSSKHHLINIINSFNQLISEREKINHGKVQEWLYWDWLLHYQADFGLYHDSNWFKTWINVRNILENFRNLSVDSRTMFRVVGGGFLYFNVSLNQANWFRILVSKFRFGLDLDKVNKMSNFFLLLEYTLQIFADPVLLPWV